MPLPNAAAPRVIRHYERRADYGVQPQTCIDLFSGAGGLAQGFRQAGFSVLSGTDLDGGAGATFRHNFPGASFFECPISDLTGAELLADAGLQPGDLGCLLGGPPCQSFSYNNHERSRRGARARLFRDYLRIVEALEPKCLVMENVPGILTVGGGAVMDEVYEALAELGYECDARVLYSEDYGVPQERRRVFFVATRLGWEDTLFPRGCSGPVPKPLVGSNPYVHRWTREPGEPYRRPPGIWAAIGDLPPLGNGQGEEVARYARAPRTPYQRLMRGDEVCLYNHVAPALSAKMLSRIAYVPEGGNWLDIPRRLLPAGMKRARKSDHTKRYGRLSKRGLCCTILTKCDPHWGSYIHPESDRAITVREAARLQSFPDSFRFLGYRKHQFVQIGNAVPPLMAAAVARAVRAHIKRNGRQAHTRAA